MSPLDLLLPEAADEAGPFSVRLAERRTRLSAVACSDPSILREAQGRPELSQGSTSSESLRALWRGDRRAHPRHIARDLEWLRAVRLTGGTGFGVTLIDVSEGGALLEVDAPLRPGIQLTLELSGTSLEVAVPLEVLRCYVASLSGPMALYRGACAFTHVIELPGLRASGESESAGFVGTNVAFIYLLERCAAAVAPAAVSSVEPRVTLERTEVLQVLESLHARGSTGSPDPLNRHAAELLGAILPALHRGAPRQVVVETLEERLRELPERWQSRLQPTQRRIASLIEHCVPQSTDGAKANLRVASAKPSVRHDGAWPGVTGQAESGFPKIVVRYADGDIIKGYTQDFHPARTLFSLWPTINAAPADRIVIPMARLKAVFFVRDFDGNPDYRERKTFTVKGQGRRVEVTFTDGETVVGTTLNYRPDGQGFFVSPADPGGNNTRVFVVSSAIRRVRFL